MGNFETRLLHLKSDGTVDILGHDLENRRPLRVHVRQNPYLVVKHPGGSGWAGVGGRRQPIRTHFLIFQIHKVRKPKGAITRAYADTAVVQEVIEATQLLAFAQTPGDIYPGI